MRLARLGGGTSSDPGPSEDVVQPGVTAMAKLAVVRDVARMSCRMSLESPHRALTLAALRTDACLRMVLLQPQMKAEVARVVAQPVGAVLAAQDREGVVVVAADETQRLALGISPSIACGDGRRLATAALAELHDPRQVKILT